MKRLIFTILFLFGASLYAQDIITLRNGNEVRARVTEISATEIRYLRFDNLDGPTRIIPRSDVFFIAYEDGTQEIITPLSEPNVATPTPQAEQPTPQTLQPQAPQVVEAEQQQPTRSFLDPTRTLIVQGRNVYHILTPDEERELIQQSGIDFWLRDNNVRIVGGHGYSRLTRNEVENLMRTSDINTLRLYNQSLSRRRNGNIVMWCGVGLIGVGGVMVWLAHPNVFGHTERWYSGWGGYYWYDRWWNWDLLVIGMPIVAGVGVVATIVGASLSLSSRNLLNNAVNSYNRTLRNPNQTNLDLRFDVVPNGVGLVLNF